MGRGRGQGRDAVTFLAPGAGIVGAAVAVPLLVMLYLLKLRRRPVRVSTVLLWEQAVRDLQANVPLRWIRPSWTFVLQLLGLACLLGAIARPAVPSAAGAGARTIIVIDRSASMSATDGDGAGVEGGRTRLGVAKAGALELIEGMRRGAGRRPEGMVVALGAEARAVTGFTSDVRELRDAVEGVTPSDQPGDLASLVRLVRGVAGAGGEEAGAAGRGRTTVAVFSDGSLEGEGEIGLPAGVDLRYVRCGPGAGADGTPYRPDNLGIVSLAARRDAESPATLRVFVRVTNAGPAAVETTLTCRLGEETAKLLRVSVPGATAGADGVSTPGETAGTFELETSAGGVVVVGIPRADVLASDNAAALVVRPVSRARVLVVGPGDAAPDPYRAARGALGIDRFLLGALEDMDLAEVRRIDGAGYEREVAGDAGLLARYDLVIFDRVTPRRMPDRPTMSFGAGVPVAGLRVEPVAEGDVARSATRVLSWQRQHPVLRHAPLDALLVAPPMRMTIEEGGAGSAAPPGPPTAGGAGAPGAAGAARPTVTALALGAGGPLMALVQEPGVRGVRRIVVGFDLVRTNWGPDVSFPVFVQSALEYLTGRGDSAAGIARTTGEPVTLAAAPGAKMVRLSGPETVTLEVAPGAVGAAPVVAWGVPERAGVYRAEGAAAEDAVVAVDVLNARESAAAVEGVLRVGAREARAGEEAGAKERPLREVWPWFVMAAVGLLTVEWFVYAWRMRA